MALYDLDYRFGPRRSAAGKVMPDPQTYEQDRPGFEVYASNARNAEPQVLAPHYKAT